MPIYYLSSLAGNYNAQDWDFNRYTPHAVIINLGLIHLIKFNL
jgi:hypothetical protein